jgi:hypothetical protein
MKTSRESASAPSESLKSLTCSLLRCPAASSRNNFASRRPAAVTRHWCICWISDPSQTGPGDVPRLRGPCAISPSPCSSCMHWARRSIPPWPMISSSTAASKIAPLDERTPRRDSSRCRRSMRSRTSDAVGCRPTATDVEHRTALSAPLCSVEGDGRDLSPRYLRRRSGWRCLGRLSDQAQRETGACGSLACRSIQRCGERHRRCRRWGGCQRPAPLRICDLEDRPARFAPGLGHVSPIPR